MKKLAIVATLLLTACADQPKTVAGFPLGASREHAERVAGKRGATLDCRRLGYLAEDVGVDRARIAQSDYALEFCSVYRERGYLAELKFRHDTLVAVGLGADPIELRWDSIE